MIDGNRARWCARLFGAAAGLATAAAAAAVLPAVESEVGMVVTSQHYASEVGATVLRQGGNAIDAAVASAAAAPNSRADQRARFPSIM